MSSLSQILSQSTADITKKRATMTITERGLIVAVEEARTLLGEVVRFSAINASFLISSRLGTAYIFSDVFDEYQYHSESLEEEEATQDEEQEVYNSAFEIQLNTLIECLNIFGTASGSSGNSKNVQIKQANGEQGSSDDENRNDGDHGDGEERRRNKRGPQTGNTSLDLFFNSSGRKTSMRMSYLGSGFPLTLLMYVGFLIAK